MRKTFWPAAEIADQPVELDLAIHERFARNDFAVDERVVHWHYVNRRNGYVR